MLRGIFKYTLFLIIIISNVDAAGLHVRGGGTFGVYRLNNSRPNSTPAFGFNSSAYYLYENIEIGLASTVFFGESNDFILEGDGDYAIGEGEQYHSYFYPYCKFRWKDIAVSGFQFYTGIGVAWSLSSTNFEDIDETNLTNLTTDEFKYNQTNFGFIIKLGLESTKSFLWGQNAYIELLFSQNYSQSIKLIGIENDLVARLIKKSDAFLKNRTRFAMVNFGLSIF